MSRSDPAAHTFAACLTPPGAGAIACLALYGPNAWEVVRLLYRPRSTSGSLLPREPEVGPLWLGLLGDAASDEVVVTAKMVAPAPLVEVHCHGGREIVRMLQELFAARGVRLCTWREFDRLTSGNALQTAALNGLAHALTIRTATVLLDQFRGAFSGAVRQVFEHWDHNEPKAAANLLMHLKRLAPVGRHLKKPWRVVLAGAPNVGKSSLANALAGYERCIVTETPGTTRDVVTTVIAVDGWPIELADTAGLRESSGELEEAGMSLARSAAGEADLCLWVLDASRDPIWPNFHLERSRFVVNKIDLPVAWDLKRAINATTVCARTGEGLPALCDAIAQALVPDPPGSGAAVPFTTRLADAVDQAWQLQAADKIDLARQALESACFEPDDGAPDGETFCKT